MASITASTMMASSTLAATMPTFSASTDTCVSVNASCPVEATIYGYYPNLAGNALFAAIFGICMIAQLVLGVYYKTWTFMIALSLGCLSETVGMLNRLLSFIPNEITKR